MEIICCWQNNIICIYFNTYFIVVRMNNMKGRIGMPDVNMYIVWAALIIAFGVLEGITVQLVSIWFVIGSVAGLVAHMLGANVTVQVIVFIAVSALSLVVTRPLVKKKLETKVVKTNADRCIGKEGVVTEDIDNLAPSGQVKADGKIWTARSMTGEKIPAGAVVTVEKIDGVKLIVNIK